MYTPTFKGAIEGYSVNFMHKNHWRIKRTHDWDDCMQEAFMVFHKCALKYPALDTPEHFMGLFKTSLKRRTDTLADKCRTHNLCVADSSAEDDEERVPVDFTGEVENGGYLQTLVRQAPSEVQSVLSLFLSAPQELLDVALSGWRAVHHRSNGDAVVCRLLGMDPDAAPMTKTLEYFTS